MQNETIKGSDEKSNIGIKDIYEMDGFIKKVQGQVIKIEDFKEINLKSGEKTFLLSFLLSDDNSAIRVACSNGRLKVVEQVLEDERVDPSVKYNYAIRMASKKENSISLVSPGRHIEVVELLL